MKCLLALLLILVSGLSYGQDDESCPTKQFLGGPPVGCEQDATMHFDAATCLWVCGPGMDPNSMGGGPAFALPAIQFGTAFAMGVAPTVIRSDSTIKFPTSLMSDPNLTLFTLTDVGGDQVLTGTLGDIRIHPFGGDFAPNVSQLFSAGRTDLRWNDGWWARTFTISDPNTVPSGAAGTGSTVSPSHFVLSSQRDNLDPSIQGWECYGGQAIASDGVIAQNSGVCKPIENDNFNIGDGVDRIQHLYMSGSLLMGASGASPGGAGSLLYISNGSIQGDQNTSQIDMPNYRIQAGGAVRGVETHWFPESDGARSLGCPGVGNTSPCPGTTQLRWLDGNFSGTVNAATFSGAFTLGAANFTAWTGGYATTSSNGVATTALNSDTTFKYPDALMSTPSSLLFSATDTLGAVTLDTPAGMRLNAGSGNIDLLDPLTVAGTISNTQGSTLATSSGSVIIGRASGGGIFPHTTLVSSIGSATKQFLQVNASYGIFSNDITTQTNISAFGDISATTFYGDFALEDIVTSGPLFLANDGGLTTSRSLLLDVNDAQRRLTFTGDPTLDDWFDQSVKTTASPTFASPVASTAFVPDATGGADLGTAALGYGALFFKDTALGFEGKMQMTNTDIAADRTLTWNWGNADITMKLRQGSASLDFPDTAIGTCDDLTIGVTGSADGDSIALGIPNAAKNAGGSQFDSWVSAGGTVTVRHCCNSGVTCDPGSGTFRATIVSGS